MRFDNLLISKLPFPVRTEMKNLTEEVKNLTVHMTQFENLSSTALNLIEGNPPSIEVQTAIKVISEGKDTSKVTKATLIKLVEYLFNEFDFKKKNDLKVISSAKVVTTSSSKEDILSTQPVPSQEETTETPYSISTTETQTTPPKLHPKLQTKIGIYDAD